MGRSIVASPVQLPRLVFRLAPTSDYGHATSGIMQMRAFLDKVSMHNSASCISGTKTDSTPISGIHAPKQPYIFGCQSLDRALRDRLNYSAWTGERSYSSEACSAPCQT